MRKYVNYFLLFLAITAFESIFVELIGMSSLAVSSGIFIAALIGLVVNNIQDIKLLVGRGDGTATISWISIISQVFIAAVVASVFVFLIRDDKNHTMGENEAVTSPAPVEELIKKPQDEPDKPEARIFTPRTPKELMDMAVTQTSRDAMRNKGVWIRVEGTVLDISPDRLVTFDENRHIEVTVGVGSQTHNRFSQTVELHLNADRWRRQVNKLGRGDWLLANGTVYYVYETFIIVINGEIISVSGSDPKNQQYNIEH